MTWEILIASVAARHEQLVALLNFLSPQLVPYDGAVSVLLDRDDAVMPVGMKRNRLMLAASADFVSYVDDDDLLHSDFVGRVMEALASDPDSDYCGFKVDYSVDGYPQKPAIHSLTNSEWSETDTAYLRGISHLNPIRRTAALTGLPFQPGFGEDKAWADRVASSGLVKTEVFIEGSAMYHYDYRTSGSLFAGGVRHVGDAPPLPEYEHVHNVRAAT